MNGPNFSANVSSEIPSDNRVQLLRGDEVEIRAVPWLWHEYVAAGRLTLLAGRPGTGKTTVALALAATVTQGGYWPDGTRAPVGTVAIWSGEDSASDTLAPRLLLAGADMANVVFIGDLLRTGGHRGFDPASDMDALSRTLLNLGDCRLLILDPVVSAVAGDSHKNAEVRRGLQPLVVLAEGLGCAVLGITHLSKGTQGQDPTERVTGSLAFAAVARTVLLTDKAKSDHGGTQRILVRCKNNSAADTGGFKYTIEQDEVPGHTGVTASLVLWGEAVDGEARDLLAQFEAINSSPQQHNAEAFLREMLSDGPMAQEELKEAAKNRGIGWRSVERAKPAAGVKSRKTGMQGPWVWELVNSPASEERQVDANTANPGSGGLREPLAPFSPLEDLNGHAADSTDDLVEADL